MRGHAATLDFSNKRQMAAFALGHVIRTNPPLARPSAMARALVRAPGITTSAADVCEAAQMLAHRFGYESNHLDDLACVYESWDGTGFPGRASGEVITSERVLSRTPMLSRLASIASAHHERLDGSGYHRAAKAAELSVTARILATADAFHTKLEARPHRAALSAEEAAKDVRAAASAGRLDGDAVEAVLAASGQPARRRASANDRWTYSTRDRDTPAGGPRTHNSTDSAHHDDCPKNGRRQHPAGLREDRYVDQGRRNPLRAAARPPGALGRLAQRQGVLPVVASSAAAKTEVNSPPGTRRK